MPRILSMKTELGKLWVCVGSIEDNPGPVHLWTDAERDEYRRRCRAQVLEEIQAKIGVE